MDNFGFELTSESEINAKHKTYSFEEALNYCGNGKYNIWLLIASFIIIMATGIDCYGVGIIVTAATCDLQLTLREVGILSSMPFAGIIVMSYPWGYLSDTKGRKVVLLWSMGCSFVCAVLSSLSPNWQTLAALRFLSSALSCAAESVAYALLGECCSSKTRARYMLIITSGLMLTPAVYYLIAYFIMKLDFSIPFLTLDLRPWRLLTLVLALPLGVSVGILPFFSESPKFLASVGNTDQALQVLKRIHHINGGEEEFSIKELYLEEPLTHASHGFSIISLWTQITPLFKPPMLRNTLLLFYLTIVVYVANNSFASMLPTLFNEFFKSYARGGTRATFCHLLAEHSDVTRYDKFLMEIDGCKDSLVDNTIWAGCVHGTSFFLLNLLISLCAGKRKIMTLVILLVAGVAAVGLSVASEAVVGLVLFYVFLTTAMVFGIISSYFVDLYPTSHRAMVACLGMLVARTSSFAGTNIIGTVVTSHCSTIFHVYAAIVFSGLIASYFLPPDNIIK